MNHRTAAQLTLTLGTLLGQNMTQMRLRSFELARRSSLEALGSASIGFHFRHYNFQYSGSNMLHLV